LAVNKFPGFGLTSLFRKNVPDLGPSDILKVAMVALLFQVGVLGTFAVGWSIYRNTTISENIRQDENLFENISTRVQAHFWRIAEATYALTKNVQDLAEQGYSLDDIAGHVERDFLFLARVEGLYHQIRIFDLQGIEKLSIDARNPVPVVVTKDQLADRSSLPYFQKMLQLETGQFMLTAIEPNTNLGEVIYPVTSVVRTFFAVDNSLTGERMGYVNINLDIDPLLAEMMENLKLAEGETHIVSETGYWIHSPSRKNEWSTFTGEGLNFPDVYPKEWQAVVNETRIEPGYYGSRMVARLIFISPRKANRTQDSGAELLNPDNQRFVKCFYLITFIKPPILWNTVTSTPLLYASLYGLYTFITVLLSMFVVILSLLRQQAENKLHHSQKLEAVGQLTGGLAHEFNNLLTTILGALRMAEKERLSKDVRVLVEMAVASAKRGANLTRRLLAFSRKQELVPKLTDIKNVITEMEPLLKHTLGENIIIETITAPGKMTVYVDPVEFESAILNLAINARDAMPSGGQLDLTVSRETLTREAAKKLDLKPGDYIVTSVSDNGIGMPEETIKKAIDPFFTTKGVGEGTGLGLSMVFGFAQQSGGNLEIISVPGNGTDIRIYLPYSINGNKK